MKPNQRWMADLLLTELAEIQYAQIRRDSFNERLGKKVVHVRWVSARPKGKWRKGEVKTL